MSCMEDHKVSEEMKEKNEEVLTTELLPRTQIYSVPSVGTLMSFKLDQP